MLQAFTSLKGNAKGMFEDLGRFWICGENWLSFSDSPETLTGYDTSMGEKRNRNGTASVATASSSQDSSSGFWVTKNYSDLLFVDEFSETEFSVVERHILSAISNLLVFSSRS